MDYTDKEDVADLANAVAWDHRKIARAIRDAYLTGWRDAERFVSELPYYGKASCAEAMNTKRRQMIDAERKAGRDG